MWIMRCFLRTTRGRLLGILSRCRAIWAGNLLAFVFLALAWNCMQLDRTGALARMIVTCDGKGRVSSCDVRSDHGATAIRVLCSPLSNVRWRGHLGPGLAAQRLHGSTTRERLERSSARPKPRSDPFIPNESTRAHALKKPQNHQLRRVILKHRGKVHRYAEKSDTTDRGQKIPREVRRPMVTSVRPYGSCGVR